MKDWTKILLIFLICSCSNEQTHSDFVYSLDRQGEIFDEAVETQEDFAEYTSWLKSESSNHFEVKKLGPFEFTALLEPSFYSFVKNEGIDEIEHYKNDHFSNQTRIEYSIALPSINGELIKVNIEDRNEYNERINYYSFQFYKDVYLVVDKDTIPCGMSVWERQFNASPTIKMQLMFPFEQDQLRDKKVQLVYYDRVFNNGLIKMNF